MKYLFVHICNALSKDGTKRTKSSVWFEAVLMLCVGTLSWLGVFVELFYFYVLDENFPSTPSSVILVAIPFTIFYYTLIRNKKYEEIFEEYKDETSKQNRLGKIIGFFYIFPPIILGMIISMAWHNKF